MGTRICPVTQEEFTDYVAGSVVDSSVELNSMVLLVCKNLVVGDFTAISNAEGEYVIIFTE